MQSFLQYRRAGLAAQAQIDRDVEKARLMTRQAQPADAHEHNIDANNRPGRDPTPDADPTRNDPIEEVEWRRESTSSEKSRSVNEEKRDEIDALADAGGMQRLDTIRTRYSARTALGRSLTGIHVRDRHAHEGEGEQVFVVGWEGEDDPLNPRNWSTARRIGVTLQISLIAGSIGAASGIDATMLPQAAKDLHVSDVAESLATGLYLIGVGVGSLFAGPFSETFGRNVVYTGGMAIFMIWIMAAGLAPNFGAQIVFRFLAGCSASTPIVCAGGSIADMYNSLEKTYSFPFFAAVGFGGPMLGAVMGAYIGPSSAVSWRWTEWTILILAGVILVAILLCMPETYGPVLLEWKAAHYRRITGDQRFKSAHSIMDSTLFSRLKVSMTRPFLMLTEPIIVAMTLYLSALYIVLFTFLIGWPYIFEYTYHTSQGLGNIIFVAMFVGTQLVYILVPIIYRRTKAALQASEAGQAGAVAHFQPEIRLTFAMYGPALAIPISLFWMGWTDFESISIWSPILASTLFGFGVTGLFICTYMYIIDSYETYSASALTFVALARYVISGGMTVVGIPFYSNMGTHYTLTILACISVALCPIPYVLYVYGPRVRARSKYALRK